MNDRERLKQTMSILRGLGYTSKLSLNPSDADKFMTAIRKTGKGAFVLGHDIDGTYDNEGNLTRRVYLAWIGNEPEEIMSVCFEQGLNVYWNGRRGFAIEVCPAHEEMPEMYF